MLPLDAQLAAAVDVVIAFANEMNMWERRMNVRSRLENGDFVRDRLMAEAVGALAYDAVLNEYYPIFRKYCTSRKRTYGGFPSSWSRDGKYKGASPETVFRCEREQPKRACVYVRAGHFPNSRFKFVLFLRNDGWLIDNAYWAYSEDRPWARAHL
jgi:hypothetical protein